MARFRARARTVDLLGRQQIAGPATALHELFKNAHDAYADHVEVDYFDDDRLLVVRDDGLGMTREEFEGRWLVVGTESKLRGRGGMDMPPVAHDKPPRPVLGEKGVGRLAVGILGDQALVVSRAVRGDRAAPTVVAFIHWGLFDLAGIDLDELEVPLVEIDTGVVTRSVVDGLVGQVRANLEMLRKRVPGQHPRIDAIARDLSRFILDPSEQERFLPGAPSLRLSTGGVGTQFWVLPATEILPDDLARPSGDDKPCAIEQQLIAFSDTATPGAPPPALRTAFRHHRSDTDVRELLAGDKFFEPGEFENADHLIRGQVDAFGTFSGTVRVFGDEHRDVTVPFRAGRGKPLRCGPFRIELAYVQGARRESTLPNADWLRFDAKARLFGGVYVYNDGIRVLPYGNTDFDWLEIEERRSKKADYYFFSHRRMCGAVHLTRAENPDLQDKAGREGFIKNPAYRHLQAVLQGVLIALAAEFFRKGSERGDKFHRTKGELERQFEARERREKQVRPKRTAFKTALETANRELRAWEPNTATEALLARLRSEIDAALSKGEDGAGRRLVELEETVRQEFRALREKYAVRRPRIALSQDLDREYRRYLAVWNDTESKVLLPAERQANELLTQAIEAAEGEGRRFDRIFKEFDAELAATEGAVRRRVAAVTAALREATTRVREGVENRNDQLASSRGAMSTRLATDLQGLTDAEAMDRVRVRHLAALQDLRERLIDDLDRMEAQLSGLSWDAAGDVTEQLVATEQALADAQARLDDELEATQLGLAIAVVSHEFDHTVQDMRDAIRALKPWAEVNPGLVPIHRRISASFEHIDGYLTLFTPLQRRLYRSAIQFTGRDIFNFLERLFRQRLREAKIAFSADEGFLETRLTGFPSAYYPVFVNLVDNAIFWLQEPRLGEPPRVLRLERDAETLLVRDSGPGVAEEDRATIFDRGFSLKPSGRGLGLTIARDAMRAVGGDLRLDDTFEGACFRIELPKDALR